MHPAADLVGTARPEMGHAQPAEPVLVPGEGHTLALVVDRERSLAEAPCRSRVFERFVDERPVADPDVVPTVVVTDADAAAIGEEPGLLDAVRRREAIEGHVADHLADHLVLHLVFHLAETGPDDPGVVPRHVGSVPFQPHRATATRHRLWVEAEIRGAVVEPADDARLDDEVPHLRLIDDVHHPDPVARHRRGLGDTIWSVIGELPRRLVGQRLPPQVAIDGGVDDRIGSAPAPTSTAEASTDARCRAPREAPSRWIASIGRSGIGELVQDDHRVALFRRSPGEAGAVRAQTGLADLTTAHAPRDRDRAHRPDCTDVWKFGCTATDPLETLLMFLVSSAHSVKPNERTAPDEPHTAREEVSPWNASRSAEPPLSDGPPAPPTPAAPPSSPPSPPAEPRLNHG